MQMIDVYIKPNGVAGQFTKFDGTPQSAKAPSITRGTQVTLAIHLLKSDSTPYQNSDINYAKWEFVLANDWDPATPPQIRVTKGICVENDVIVVPILDTNTIQLIQALGTNESVTLGAELCGMSTESDEPQFIVQFPVIARNRRGDVGLGALSPDPAVIPLPDLPTHTEDGQYLRQIIGGVRSWAKIACATIADVTASILSHNTDKSAHEGVLIPEVPDESALFVRQGSGVGEWRWFKTSEGVIFGTDLYNHKIAQNAHTELFATRIAKSEKGVANGVASLDANAKIPMSQIPSLEYITEAPMDGKMYARKDGAWVEIAVAPPEPIAGTVLTDNDVQLTDNDNILFF